MSRDESVVKGPYLHISHNFPKGATISELIEEGVLSKEFQKLNYEPLIARRLYVHQETAIRKVTSGRNIVVSTGTGSGKTESFLIPILDSLMRENEAGTLTTGVRVMLLYPLNALANDQMERMRDVLRNYPDITFGTFTGETEETKADADNKDFGIIERVQNEVYDRTTFRKSPPHILITNYAMLEHLLIKPENNSLFGTPGENHWKFIVLDEAHTYTGSKGSEVSMLIRRLKATLGNHDLRFILTSATLGSYDQDDRVAEFASKLCSSDFDRSDVIRSQYIPMEMPEVSSEPDREFYRRVSEIVSSQEVDVESGLSDVLSEFGYSNDNPRENLYDVMYSDPLVHEIADVLDDGPMTVNELSDILDVDEDAIFDLITSVSATKKLGDRIFNARYHLFVKGLDGAFVTLKGSDRLFIEPRKTFTDDSGNEFAVFQISTCYNCNAIYLLGNRRDGRFVQVSRYSSDYAGYEPYLLLSDDSLDDEFLEDMSENVYTLCSVCGSLTKGDKPSCICGSQYSNKVIRVSDKEKVSTCPVCGNRDSRRGLLRQLYLGNDASTAVIASSLFKDLINSRDARFLAFSDNRQSAAFFAPYMEDTYRGILMKRIIYETMCQNLGRLENGVSFKEFVEMVKKVSDRNGNLLSEADCLDAVVRECAQNNSHRSLEFLGFLRFEYGFEKSGQVWEPKDMPGFNISADEVYNLFNTLVKYVRDRRAVTFESTDFKPFEYRRGYTMEGGQGRARFFNNSLQSYLGSILGDKANEFATRFMKGCLKFENGASYLDLSCLKVTIPRRVYRCSRCRSVFPFSVRGRCFKCNSETLVPQDVNAIERMIDGVHIPVCLDMSNHYIRTIIDSPLRKFNIKEHTAQLSRETARTYQNLFREKKLDALSCSTTFEMGVDIGTLNSVLMRNVPPSPANYVQRAGRAGRGEDASAFTVTFCREASHDLTYFQHPEDMIDGEIGVPMIKPENKAIVIRHMIASAFNFFWKEHGGYPKNAKTLVETYDDFKAYLDARPTDLQSYLKDIVPDDLCDNAEGIDVSNFGWTDELFNSCSGEKIGRLYEAVFQYKTDKGILENTADVAERMSLKGELEGNKLKTMLSKLTQADKTSTALSEVDALSFLSRHNLIPKYGFPVDVVPMVPASGSSRDDLTRNMQLAIGEFAPGSEVIVDGRKVRSQYITPIRGGQWIQYRYKRCDSCGKVTTLIDNYLDDADDPNMERLSRCSCGAFLNNESPKRFIRPDMGFKYVDEKMSVAEKPRHASAGRMSFCDSYSLDESIHTMGQEQIQIIPRTNSRLVAVNETQYCVCNRCGYALEISKLAKSKSFEHKRPDNQPCPNKSFNNTVGLGHVFYTDAMVVRFITTPCRDLSTAMSVLYSILEGFCREFSVERSEVGGCLDNVDGNFSLILYDTTPGGSGYISLMSEESSFLRTLSAATEVVRDCTCGGDKGDTSCYSCLRSYSNQIYHDILVRGRALEFLESLKLEI